MNLRKLYTVTFPDGDRVDVAALTARQAFFLARKAKKFDGDPISILDRGKARDHAEIRRFSGRIHRGEVFSPGPGTAGSPKED